jgi:hypothetical protein
MRIMFVLLFSFLSWFVAGVATPGQDGAQHANLIELMVNPRKFDGTMVTVHGYLVLSEPVHDISASFLYLYKEDADNLLDNAILIVPSKEMRNNKDKINRMYVTLTGKFRAVPAGQGFATAIKEIVSCTLWSDPKRPVGLNQNTPGS